MNSPNLRMKSLTPEQKECQGKVYRAKRSVFLDKNGALVSLIRMTPAKRKSCPGCKNCGWIEDYLKETVNEGEEYTPAISDVETGAYYNLYFQPDPQDWEGHVDGGEFYFSEVKEE